jgi:hypothetical protein
MTARAILAIERRAYFKKAKTQVDLKSHINSQKLLNTQTPIYHRSIYHSVSYPHMCTKLDHLNFISFTNLVSSQLSASYRYSSASPIRSKILFLSPQGLLHRFTHSSDNSSHFSLQLSHSVTNPFLIQ